MNRINLLFPLKDILPGSLVFVSQKHLAAKLIRFYEGIEDLEYLFNGGFLPHHVQIYIGKGKNLCFSAEASGCKLVSIYGRLVEDATVVIVNKIGMTQEEFACIKSYCYGAKGKPYNFGGIANFGLKALSWIPGIEKLFRNKIGPWDWALFCSELAVESYQCIDEKTSDKKPNETTPADMIQFMGERSYKLELDRVIGKYRFRLLCLAK